MSLEKYLMQQQKLNQKNNPREIILIDAHSIDGTKELAKPYVTRILEDTGLSLATARNYGLKYAKGKNICNVGPDNILPQGSLKQCIDYLNNHNHIGVSIQTFIKNSYSSYLSYVMNLHKKARFFLGPRFGIGTPHLFILDVLKKCKFDNKMFWSDDSDLYECLSKLGYTFGIANTFVYEIGTENINSIIIRWKNYGIGDFAYYLKYSKKLKLKRKILSLLRPFHSEFIVPLSSRRLKVKEKIGIIPFLLFISILRYVYWIKYAIINRIL